MLSLERPNLPNLDPLVQWINRTHSEVSIIFIVAAIRQMDITQHNNIEKILHWPNLSLVHNEITAF